MGVATKSQYPFDPTYGCDETQLLASSYPEIPREYEGFWKGLYSRALEVKTRPVLSDAGETRSGYRVFEIYYRSTRSVRIGGWLLLPQKTAPKRAFVVSHGYGGREGPDFHLPFDDAALLFPCCRGMSRSPHYPISGEARYHVLHDIDKPTKYIHGGCAQDIWTGVSTLIRLFPDLEERIGFLGISFGGGIGAMAVAMDKRIKRAHFNVPSFGNQPLRLTLPTLGSGESVQKFYRKNPKKCLETLRLYDSAISAQFVTVPTLVACALYDPMVAPPGQFAVFNAIRAPKELFILKAAHHDYPEKAEEDARLIAELKRFFSFV